MTHLAAIGDWGAGLPLLASLPAAGYPVTIANDGADAPPVELVLVALAPGDRPDRSWPGAGHRGARWLAWNRGDDPDAALAAYRAGALAVLPAATTGEVLRASVEHALAGGAEAGERRAGRAVPPRRRSYRRGQLIALARDTVLEVETGVVAVTVVDDDGAEVLLGLSGPGRTLVGHGPDGCGIRLHARTEAVIALRSWAEAARDPIFPEQLAARLREMEAWAAMQARPYLDQRVLGTLSLLAEQFGAPGPSGTVVDVRVTHAQLAAAVGATRTTVTRILGDLRTRSLVATVGAGADERFCLPGWERNGHVHGSSRPRRDVAEETTP